jgi:serine/threonine protein kinase
LRLDSYLSSHSLVVSLTSGTRLGPYEITAQIGAGGMGEVYRATDTNLKRQVAIKVLPAAVAADAERLARFQREAEVLALLNHPNIAIVYGLEKTDAVTGLVMELVEGPTLADRLAQGPISVEEALPIAKQIAEALEAAHGQGIIHRDLKPANVKIRDDGTVKVLDFGLAKTVELITAASTNVTASPTITSPAMMTGLGMILGTAAYMSPEQARGKAVDKRADIWAFGCVLYEMLSGRRVFGGDSVSETLARVIEREPSLSGLPTNIPPSVVRLIRRALVKDPRMRLPDIAMARLEIDDAVAGPQSTTARTRLWPRVSPWAFAALSTAAALGLLWKTWSSSDRPSTAVERLELPLQPGVELYKGTAPSFALSRDGTRLAYIASREAAALCMCVKGANATPP